MSNYGFFGTVNNYFNFEAGELQTLASGKLVNNKSGLFFPVEGYHGSTFIYSGYFLHNVPDKSLIYRGVIINNQFFSDFSKVKEKMIVDIDQELKRLVPTLKAASSNMLKIVGDIEKKPVYYAEQIKNEVEKCYYNNTQPTLTLFSDYNFSTNEVIDYLIDPDEKVKEFSEKMKVERCELIFDRYEVFETITKDLKLFEVENPEKVKIKKLVESLADTKTVKVTLTNGNTVKVETDGLKYLKFSNWCSTYYVSAKDRKLLNQTAYGRPEDITIKDIVTVTHGKKVLYSI